MAATRPPYFVDAATVTRSVYDLGGLTGGVVTVRGGGLLQSESYVAGTAGWLIQADGTVEFNSGVFRGQLVAGSIDIPDTTSANSFHVDSNGNTWWGATSLGSALASVTNAGVATFTDLVLTGTGGAGTATLDGGAIYRTAASGQRVEMSNTATTIGAQNIFGVAFYTGLVTEDDPGYIGVVQSGGAADYYMFIMPPVQGTYSADPVSIELRGGAGLEAITLYVTDNPTNNSGSVLVQPGLVVVGASESTPNNANAQFGSSSTGAGNATTYISASTGTGTASIVLSADYVQIPVGSASAPGLAFAGDLDTGIFHYAVNSLGVTVGGVQSFVMHSNQEFYLAGDIVHFEWGTNTSYLQVLGGTYVRFVSDGSEIFRIISDGTAMPGGTYGSIYLPNGHGAGGYEGVNIHGSFAFMGNGTSFGLYDDVNNVWALFYSVSATLDNNRGTIGMAADAADPDLDVNIGWWTPDSDTGGGATGTGYILFNNEIGGFSGTTADLTTSTISGITGKRLGFHSSTQASKTDTQPWELSDEAFRKLAPKSFLVNDMYVDEQGRHHHWPKKRALEEEGSHEPPEDWVFLRRFGLIWDDIMADEELWPFATDVGLSDHALIAGLISVLSRVLDRLDANDQQHDELRALIQAA